MARVNPKLVERLKDNFGVGRSRLYALIDKKVRETHLPRHLAAIVLASQRGINISKYATEEELARIRQPAVPAAAAPVTAPAEASPRPARRRTTAPRARRRATPRARGTKVFVVHGRNEDARDALFQFLRTLGLQPIEWTQAIEMTGEPSPYVGTILDTAFREAEAVVVLLTPDDEARLKRKYRKQRDPAYEKRLSGQARPNVLFEAGMAFGTNPEKTVLVQLGDTRPFSDVAGRHLVHLSNHAASRQELAAKLENAGCKVDKTGTDWLTAGDFRV